jgi:hypothetical protein
MARYQSRWTNTLLRACDFWLASDRHPPRCATRLQVEPLERRCVPTTITPTTLADGGLGSGSLRDAVLQFNADTGTEDDIIQLLPGTYSLSIQNAGGRHEAAGLTGDLNLTQTRHRWIIQGAGPSTVIDASQLQDRVFQIVNPGTQVVFQDLVIQGGLAQDNGADGALAGTTDALGGGIFSNGGDLTLDDVVVQNNLARGGDVAVLSTPGHNGFGGGIYSTGGALRVAGARLANNQVSGGRAGDHSGFQSGGNGGDAGGGGLYATGGSLDIAGSMIASNRATGGQGGDGSFSSCNYLFCSRNGGTGGAAQGGGLYVNGSALTISTSAIATNQGTGGPGGLFGLEGAGEGGGLFNGGRLTVSNSTVSGNSATGYFSGGGAIYNSGPLTVSNSTLSGNTGGISNSNYGTLTVTNSTLSGNTGDAISNYGTVTVSNSTLSGNSDGIHNSNGAMLTLSNSTLSGNTFGAFNSNYATLTVTNSTVSGNTGWAIDNEGGLTVTGSTLSGNSGRGGISNQGALTVTNSTLSGNSSSLGGGGIWTNGAFPVRLTNVTVTANRATSGGGLDVTCCGPSPVLHNTLIAGNFRGATGTTRDDVSGRLDPGGDYNLIGDGTGMTGLSNGVNGNQVGSASSPIDPLLGPLQNNGGPTQTMALLPGSPAIDAGDNTGAPMWDQRGPGFPRILHGTMDIGAFEYRPARQLDPNPVPIPEPGPSPDLRQDGLPGSQPTLELAATTRTIVTTNSTGNRVTGGAVAPVDGYFALHSEEKDAGEANAWLLDGWLNQELLFA